VASVVSDGQFAQRFHDFASWYPIFAATFTMPYAGEQAILRRRKQEEAAATAIL
jgi:hypothetical protein